ncbi:MAG: cysteine hydrolase [Chloroflexi bacterium]|nr:cysteine hydrolase [Chloroflexota bacterium]
MAVTDYASAFKRRFTIDPARAALVVIDMQYASGSRQHGLGASLTERGEEQTGSWRFDRIEQVVVPNLQLLLDRCRAHGVQVVYVTLGSATGDFADVVAYLRPLVEQTDNRAGAPNHRILDAIAPQDGDLVVNKTTASAFQSSDLDDQLRERGITQLLLAGISTNSCVESTGRDGADLGYECLMVDDACACAGPDWHDAALRNFDRLFGRVGSTADVLAEAGLR